MLQRVLKWWIFSVFVGLLPIGWTALSCWTAGQTVSLELLSARGELLLIGCAISAGALGELLTSGRMLATWKLVCGGGCLLSLMIDALWFSDIASYLVTAQTYDGQAVAVGSFLLFTCNLVAASGCILLSEVSDA